MEHLSEKQLLDVLEHQDVKENALEDHISQCVFCKHRVTELQATWDVLGHWTVETPDIDLTDRILQKARPIRRVRLRQPRVLLRIAASIIIGIGLGAHLGRPKPESISDHQVAQAMHLDLLALNSSTGWASPLLSGDEER